MQNISGHTSMLQLVFCTLLSSFKKLTVQIKPCVRLQCRFRNHRLLTSSCLRMAACLSTHSGMTQSRTADSVRGSNRMCQISCCMCERHLTEIHKCVDVHYFWSGLVKDVVFTSVEVRVKRRTGFCIVAPSLSLSASLPLSLVFCVLQVCLRAVLYGVLCTVRLCPENLPHTSVYLIKAPRSYWAQ